MAIKCHFRRLARPLLHDWRPLGSTPGRGGAAVLWSSCPAPSPFLGLGSDQLLELAALEHFHHDVRTADKLALDVELRDRRPITKFLDSLPHLRVLEHVDRLVLGAQPIEDRDGAARKAALREEHGARHEKNDIVLADDVRDAGLGVTHWSSPYSALRFRAAMREAHPLHVPQARHRPPGAA